MRTDWDSSAYIYAWLLDGSPVTGGDQYSNTFTAHGNHTLKSISSRIDDSADTVTTSLSVKIATGVTGDGSLGNGQTGNWTIWTTGGHAPYSCVWYLDSSVVQSGSCNYSTSFSDGPTVHTLDVDVTDNDSGTGTSPYPSFAVEVHTCSNGGCDDQRSVAPRRRADVSTVPPARPRRY